MKQKKTATLILLRLIVPAIIACTSTLFSYAQPPVTSGLKLHLEAGKGFNPNGALPATWTDQSHSGNDMTADMDATEPTFVSPVPGTAFDGIQFSESSYQYMQNKILNNSFSNTEATLFVVRIANTASSIEPNSHTLLSISEDGNFYNEFCMNSNLAIHHTWSGNFQYRDHQCFSSLPDDRPVVLTAVFGTAVSDIAYYVNNVLSTNALSPVAGYPLPYPSLDRRIYVGTRLRSGNPQEFFDGYIFEVLAYDHQLTSAEVDKVNDYLRCKYDVRYAACNLEPLPVCNDNGTAISELGPVTTAGILHQNNPNPCHGQTTIPFNTGNIKNAAEIVVSDMMGKRIISFTEINKGEGHVTWNTTSCPPGIYLCSLIVDGNIVDYKKITISY